MKLAIISDLHSNMEAVQEVLADIEQVGVDAILSLGDNIGYGPEPQEVIDLITERGIPSIIGNHELAVIEPKYQEWFNELARKALTMTADLLTDEGLEYCRSLDYTMVIANCLLVHGCPPDSALRYIFEPTQTELAQLFENMEQHICFVGHTHVLEIFRYDGKTVRQATLGESRMQLEPECKYIVNTGSVGQPRDVFSKDAKYVIWDAGKEILEIRFVPYDKQTTANKIIKRGLPEFNARRLL